MIFREDLPWSHNFIGPFFSPVEIRLHICAISGRCGRKKTAMYTKTLGLVLRETDYKDADKLLTVLTRDRGKLTLRARGIRSRSSRLKSGCQLLAYSEFTVFENRNAMVVDEAVAQELFLPLRQDIELLALASYFAQVTETLAREEEPDTALLSLTLNALAALSRPGAEARKIKAAFEFRAACIAGYSPMLEGCCVCGREDPDRFLVRGGCLACAGCRTEGEPGLRLPISAGSLAALRYLSTCPPRRVFSFQLGEASMKELCDVAETYLLTQLERGFFTLDFYKSLQMTDIK